MRSDGWMIGWILLSDNLVELMQTTSFMQIISAQVVISPIIDHPKWSTIKGNIDYARAY